MSGGRELLELTRVRVVLFLREPEAIFWVFVFPLVLAAVLGFAFRRAEVEPGQLGLVDGPGADELVEILERDEGLEVTRFEGRKEARDKLRSATIDGLLDPEGPRYRYDPQRTEAEALRVRVMRALELDLSGGREAPLTLDPVEETGTRYVDFLFPGLLGMNLMGTGMWGIGFAIADVRRRKLLKRLLVTPMRRSNFFLSFLFSRLVFLALEVIGLCLVGALLLGVPFRAPLLGFCLLSCLGALTFAGLGLLCASRARTIEGVSGLMNLVMMPMWLASGVFFSYERFPEVLHPLLRLLPLTALNDGLRALMLDGEGLLAHVPELLVLVGWSVGSFVLALKIFRWE